MPYFSYNYQVTTHEQICSPSMRQHHCSREVISVMGYLLITKSIIGAFLAPGLSLLGKLIRQRCFAGGRARFQQDVELSKLLMALEQLLVFGFTVPLLLPLFCIWFLVNTVVYHCAVSDLLVPVRNAVRPSMQYLHAAHLLGCSLIIWVWVDNDLHGKYLVYFGVPLCSCGGYLAGRYWQGRARVEDLSGLQLLREPLVDQSGQILALEGS